MGNYLTRSRIRCTRTFALILLLLLWYSTAISYAQSSDTSQEVTWTCTGSPCDWGSSLSGQALVWPASLGGVSQSFGLHGLGGGLSSGE